MIITTDLNFLLYRQIIYIFIINIFASRKIIKKCFCFVLFFIKMGTQNWAIWGNVSLSMWCKVKISIQDSFFFIQRVRVWFYSIWIKVSLRSHFHQRYIHLKKNLPTKRKILKSQDITAKVKEHMCSVYSLAKLKLIQVVFFVISWGKKSRKLEM